MNKPKSKLVVLTSGFPYDDKEPFFENELTFLQNSFDQLVIIPVDLAKEGDLRPFPSIKCTLLSGAFEASKVGLGSKIRTLFRRDFLRELKEIIRNKDFRLNLLTIKTAVVSLARASNLKRFIEEQSVIIENTVFYSFWTDDAGITLALLKRKYPHLKCVSRAHGWDLYFTTNSIHYLPFRGFICAYLDRIVTDSKAGAEYINKNWTNASLLHVSASQMGVKKQALDFKTPTSFVVVSCSNLVPVKRVHLLATALIELAKSKPIKWVHFGDGELMTDLKKQLNLNSNSKLEVELKGHVLNEEVLNWYRKNEATVFVNVSESEGIPVSVMEAMSFGIPVIATNVGGNSEIVNATNGYLLPADFALSELCNALTFFESLSSEEYLFFCKNALMTQQVNYQDTINYQLLIEKLKN